MSVRVTKPLRDTQYTTLYQTRVWLNVDMLFILPRAAYLNRSLKVLFFLTVHNIHIIYFLQLTSRTCLRHSTAGSTAGCSSAAGKNPFQQPAVTIEQPVHSFNVRTKPATSINCQPDINNPQQQHLQSLE